MTDRDQIRQETRDRLDIAMTSEQYELAAHLAIFLAEQYNRAGNMTIATHYANIAQSLATLATIGNK